MSAQSGSTLRVVGLFAGIGGIERGLEQAGHRSRLLCELDPAAQLVLADRFPNVETVADVRDLRELPDADLVAAGFPCQDLSQAGRTAGIRGRNSGLVGEVFRLLQNGATRWLLLENVPFMLQLERGDAMRHLTTQLERHGFNWAYRVVDTRAFGIPQRRRRVLLLASREEDPRPRLLGEDSGETVEPERDGRACGFYWTEGTRGLGWADDAIPTLKGGSGVGIPSPPAIRLPDGRIALPDLRDAERLQGFPADWTVAAAGYGRRGTVRWKLVGNAVSVPVARWIGDRLRADSEYDAGHDEPLLRGSPWPTAAWGGDGVAHRADVSSWPVQHEYQHLAEFLRYPVTPLSARASQGFLRRARASTLRFPDGFLADVEAHLERVSEDEALAA